MTISHKTASDQLSYKTAASALPILLYFSQKLYHISTSQKKNITNSAGNQNKQNKFRQSPRKRCNIEIQIYYIYICTHIHFCPDRLSHYYPTTAKNRPLFRGMVQEPQANYCDTRKRKPAHEKNKYRKHVQHAYAAPTAEHCARPVQALQESSPRRLLPQHRSRLPPPLPLQQRASVQSSPPPRPCRRRREEMLELPDLIIIIARGDTARSAFSG